MTGGGMEQSAGGRADIPGPTLRDRIGAEQVAALYRVVTPGVIAATAGAVILGATLYRLGHTPAPVALAWSGYIAACAIAHILLSRRYDRARPAAARWRLWAYRFAAVSLAEGLGWGAATLVLPGDGGFEVRLLVLIVTFGVAAGAVPAFSPFPPAFFGLFLPATLPFALASVVSPDPMQQAGSLLMLVFVLAVGSLSVSSSRAFRQIVSLRFQTEAMADDLRRQKEIAEQASLAKSTFLAAASHDLRQPVHALGLFVGALRGIDMPIEGRRLVGQIEASTTAMDGLFSALLDISRLDAGIVEVHRRRFAIGPFLARICSEYRREAEARALGFGWAACSAVVESDPVLMERILRNLVSNAVRHTQAGRILVGCRRRPGQVAVQVWDTGPGIPPDQQERVFQEYYQLGNSERDRTRGLGLGLAIVRRLTRLLECPLRLRSEPGRGSCFEVAVPLAAGPEDSESPAEAGEIDLPATGLVVVVDDELAIREAMSSLLASWGHEVISAGSGEDAIERLSTCPVRPNIIISDYRLRDGETGIDVIEALRSEYNDTIPAMLITGDTAPDRLVEAQASGLLLLHKPVSNSRLRAAIAHLGGLAGTPHGGVVSAPHSGVAGAPQAGESSLAR